MELLINDDGFLESGEFLAWTVDPGLVPAWAESVDVSVVCALGAHFYISIWIFPGLDVQWGGSLMTTLYMCIDESTT